MPKNHEHGYFRHRPSWLLERVDADVFLDAAFGRRPCPIFGIENVRTIEASLTLLLVKRTLDDLRRGAGFLGRCEGPEWGGPLDSGWMRGTTKE